MEYFDEQDTRIAKILGVKNYDDMGVDDRTFGKYLAYLKKNIKFPCHLTGIEDFPWEERYVFGAGSQTEYEKLKKSRASYTDVFAFIEFADQIEEDYGFMANVQRLSDKKKFTLPLADLEASDQRSENFQLFEDYASWFVNHG